MDDRGLSGLRPIAGLAGVDVIDNSSGGFRIFDYPTGHGFQTPFAERVRQGADIKDHGRRRDIATDLRWASYGQIPLSAGLKACWSRPIIGKNGEVLGALAFYFQEVRSHTRREAEIVQDSTHLCAIALESDRQPRTQYRLAYIDMLTDLPNRAAFDRARSARPWPIRMGAHC